MSMNDGCAATDKIATANLWLPSY